MQIQIFDYWVFVVLKQKKNHSLHLQNNKYSSDINLSNYIHSFYDLYQIDWYFDKD